MSGAIEVGAPGAGTELDADLSLSGKKPSGEKSFLFIIIMCFYL